MTSQLDYLDECAARVARGEERGFGGLSTGERVYVALAANRADLLEADGWTLAAAIARLDADWLAELVRRWQYRGDPKSR